MLRRALIDELSLTERNRKSGVPSIRGKFRMDGSAQIGVDR